MQCPLMKFSCCCFTPKVILMALGFLGLAIGILSAFWPKHSIRFYQWIMKQFNWQVAPIDEAREMRNTKVLGFFLILLSVGIFMVVRSRF